MKGISESSCGREASATSWRFRALNSYCSTNFMLFGSCLCLAGRCCFLSFFFPSRIILARDFFVFTEFAKKELPVVQQKVCMCIVYFHLNAAEF